MWQMLALLQVNSELCSPPAALQPKGELGRGAHVLLASQGCSPLPMETLTGQTELAGDFKSSSLKSAFHHWCRQQANWKWNRTGLHVVLTHSQGKAFSWLSSSSAFSPQQQAFLLLPCRIETLLQQICSVQSAANPSTPLQMQQQPISVLCNESGPVYL